jgi:hypothetical protein
VVSDVDPAVPDPLDEPLELATDLVDGDAFAPLIDLDGPSVLDTDFDDMLLDD